MRHTPRIIVLSALLGLLLLGLSAAETRQPWGVSNGFPLTYSYPNPPSCGKINSFNGCGYSYDPLLIGLDYLFWLGIAAIVVSAIEGGWSRFGTHGGANSRGSLANQETHPSVRVM